MAKVFGTSDTDDGVLGVSQATGRLALPVSTKTAATDYTAAASTVCGDTEREVTVFWD